MIPLLFGCGQDRACTLDAGTYETSGGSAFLPGMRVTVPAGWFSDEQDTGEFNLHPVDSPSSSVFFWKDLIAVKNDQAGTPVPGVPATAAGLVAWLRSDPDLVVTKPKATMVGPVPMVMVDVQVSTTAKTPGPGCPADPCVGFLKDPRHWSHQFAIARGWIARFYFGTIGGLSGTKHTFVVEIEAQAISDSAALEAFTTRSLPILNSVGIPEVIVDN